MFLIRYLKEKKMELLCQKIEFSIRIKLKTTFHWLINKVQLKEYLEIRNKKRPAIVITYRNKVDVSRLCIKEFRFRVALKVIEKYWEAGPSSAFMNY